MTKIDSTIITMYGNVPSVVIKTVFLQITYLNHMKTIGTEGAMITNGKTAQANAGKNIPDILQ
ncbi:hypothetical protein [Ruminococcus sp. HUN007]|uniref:hypothetical protein n=1 Tax=Ruminococcus sp. HUN007 TaxID=1514668 RepID=UPI0005D14357|nr:hypothetical protein [Ruminococcus sp. HUN007]